MCQICCPRISLGLSCFCHKALARTGENWCISPSTMTTGRPPNTAVELPSGFFTALHCLSIESISVELTMLTSSVISMVVSVHNDLTRREGPHLRRDPTAAQRRLSRSGSCYLGHGWQNSPSVPARGLHGRAPITSYPA